MTVAQSVFTQLPLWGRLIINGVIFFGLFGWIPVIALAGLYQQRHNDGSTSENVD